MNMKKTILHSFIFIMAMAGLFGCAKEDAEKVTLRFWNGFTGPDGRTMLRMVQRFNRENPDVHVLMQRMEWATYYNKLFVAGLGDRAPEVFIVHASNIERFMLADFIRPVDDLMAGPHGLDENDFSENIWNAVEKDGSHYALPLDVHVLGMYYNRKLFREAGIVDEEGNPDPPESREEFMEALKKLTRDTDGDGEVDQWGYVYTWYRTNVYTMMHQWGGRFFTPDKTECLLDCPENIKALQFCSDLIRKHNLVPPPENFDSWIGFRQGKVGIAFEGIYMLEDLKKQKDLEYGGAPLPVLGKVPAAWCDSHTICFRKDLKEKKLETAWRFARYLSDHSLHWAEGGQIPVRKSLRNTERFRKMEIQREFAKQIPYVQYVPRVPFIFEFLTEFDTAVEKALRGSASPDEALKVATDNVNTIIRRQEKWRKTRGEKP